jgi:hypothetical protein
MSFPHLILVVWLDPIADIIGVQHDVRAGATVMYVSEWLRNISLGKYEAIFCENAIDAETLSPRGYGLFSREWYGKGL